VNSPAPCCKADLRRRIRHAILAMTSPDRADLDRAVHERLLDSLMFRTAGAVLLYASHFPEEIQTQPLLEAALAAGKTLVLPRVGIEPGRMDLCRVTEPGAELVPGKLAIPEPCAECPLVGAEAIDLVLVPGLAFDAVGYRLGRGGGFYDRLLADDALDAETCSIAYEIQLIASVPREPHDQPVQTIVTEKRTLRIG
jgi:5-formyltetrahydrofolate cyclo-ligase